MDLDAEKGPATLSRALVWSLLLVFGLPACVAQSAPQAPPEQSSRNLGSTSAGSLDDSPGHTPPLRIGPGDELEISVYDVPDMTQRVRVESTGDISLPLINHVHVAGLSSDDAQAAVEHRLSSEGFIKNPHVTIYVKEYTGGGIIVQGQVSKPGVYPAYGRRRLSDMLLQAGGVTQTAGNKISIVHPGQTTPEVVNLSADPAKAADVAVAPGDTITVSKAGIVYVIGEVTRPGGFVLQSSDDDRPAGMSAIQAMALASGPTRTAALDKARVIRRTPTGVEQINLPLKKIMDGKGSDPQLQAEDILFVPNSRMKAAAEQIPGTVISLLASAAIYRF